MFPCCLLVASLAVFSLLGLYRPASKALQFPQAAEGNAHFWALENISFILYYHQQDWTMHFLETLLFTPSLKDLLWDREVLCPDFVQTSETVVHVALTILCTFQDTKRFPLSLSWIYCPFLVLIISMLHQFHVNSELPVLKHTPWRFVLFLYNMLKTGTIFILQFSEWKKIEPPFTVNCGKGTLDRTSFVLLLCQSQATPSHWCLRHVWNWAIYSVNLISTEIRYFYWL